MNERMRVAAVQTIAGGDVVRQPRAGCGARGGGGGARGAAHRAAGIFRHSRRACHGQARCQGTRRRGSATGLPCAHGARTRCNCRGRERADRQRGSRSRQERVPGLRARRRANRTLRQNSPVPIHARCRGLRRDAHDRAGRQSRGVRRALRPRGTVDLLRRALSGAVSRPSANARCCSCPPRSRRRRARRTGSCCCARAPSKTSATCSPPRKGGCIRTAGARGDIRCSSIPGARSSP